MFCQMRVLRCFALCLAQLLRLLELEAHLDLLSSQITADTRRHRALRELRDLALSAGATGESRVIDTLCACESLLAEVA